MIPRLGWSEQEGPKWNELGYSEDEARFFEQLRQDFGELRFVRGRKFAFRPPRTIAIGPAEPFSRLLVLHEVGHAVLKHRSFKADVERLRMEMAAWEKARELAPGYGIEWEEDVVQRELDTYRDWLHQKSRCPKCGLTRFQDAKGQYRCPRCNY